MLFNAYAKCHYAECRNQVKYGECRYAECRGLKNTKDLAYLDVALVTSQYIHIKLFYLVTEGAEK